MQSTAWSPGSAQRGDVKDAPHTDPAAERRGPARCAMRVPLPESRVFREVKQVLREQTLHTVCEEARCPTSVNASAAAAFMVLGDLCTRRCPFCDVAHGRP